MIFRLGNKPLYFFGYVYCIFMCFTRIFVGLHTLEQLLLGFGLGLIIHITVIHLLQDTFDRLFTGIETGKTKWFNWMIILNILMLILAFVLYFYIDNYDPAPVFWFETVKKSWPPSRHFISFHFSCLNKYLVTFASLGAYCGCFFRRWILKWKDGSKFIPLKSKSKTLLRILVNFIITVIWSFSMFIVPKTASIPSLLFFKSFIGPFMATFAAMVFTFKVNKSLNI